MSDETREISVQRLFHDEQGESHFSDEPVSVTAAYFAPPAPPIYVSDGAAGQAGRLPVPASGLRR